MYIIFQNLRGQNDKTLFLSSELRNLECSTGRLLFIEKKCKSPGASFNAQDHKATWWSSLDQNSGNSQPSLLLLYKSVWRCGNDMCADSS